MDHGFGYFEKANVDVVFAFGLWYAITSLDKQKINEQADIIFGKTPVGKNQVVFIENHDLDRSATLLGQDAGKQRAAAALSLLIGGMPSIYYGQELGMTGDGGFGKYGDTDGNDIPSREAFEWHKAGRGEGMAFWYKNTGPWWDSTNVKANDGISFEEQQKDDKSLFNFYKAILKTRNTNTALSAGKYQGVENDNSKVFSFMRENGKDKVLVVVNLSSENQNVNLRRQATKYSALYGKGAIVNNRLSLAPYEVGVWAIR
jgi:glycosidase